MDDFKDFAKEIRNRISNPFVFSFIASWLLTNWSIPLAILFYDKVDLKNDGYKTLHDLIIFNSRNWGWYMLAWPFIMASIYTFGFPWAKAFIKLYIAKIVSKNETQILDKTNQGAMPMSKFIKLRDEHIQTINELKKLHKEESGYLVINANLEKDKAELIKDKLKIFAEKNSSEQRFDMYKNLSTHLMTNGDWEINFTTKDFNIERHKLNFSEDIVRNLGKIDMTYMVEDLVINPFQNLLHFQLRPEDHQDRIGPVTLHGDTSLDYFRLRGVHPYYESFTMTKIKKKEA